MNLMDKFEEPTADEMRLIAASLRRATPISVTDWSSETLYVTAFRTRLSVRSSQCDVFRHPAVAQRDLRQIEHAAQELVSAVTQQLSSWVTTRIRNTLKRVGITDEDDFSADLHLRVYQALAAYDPACETPVALWVSSYLYAGARQATTDSYQIHWRRIDDVVLRCALSIQNDWLSSPDSTDDLRCGRYSLTALTKAVEREFLDRTIATLEAQGWDPDAPATMCEAKRRKTKDGLYAALSSLPQMLAAARPALSIDVEPDDSQPHQQTRRADSTSRRSSAGEIPDPATAHESHLEGFCDLLTDAQINAHLSALSSDADAASTGAGAELLAKSAARLSAPHAHWALLGGGSIEETPFTNESRFQLGLQGIRSRAVATTKS